MVDSCVMYDGSRKASKARTEYREITTLIASSSSSRPSFLSECLEHFRLSSSSGAARYEVYLKSIS